MNTKHTPGPWMVHNTGDADGWRLVMAGGPAGRIVANVNAESCPDCTSAPAFVQMPCEANARLIAAAPEMLKALEDLFEHCAMVHKHWGDNSNQKQADEAQRNAIAAIAKARGNV